MFNLTLVCDRSRDVAMVTIFGIESAKLAYPTFTLCAELKGRNADGRVNTVDYKFGELFM